MGAKSSKRCSYDLNKRQKGQIDIQWNVHKDNFLNAASRDSNRRNLEFYESLGTLQYFGVKNASILRSKAKSMVELRATEEPQIMRYNKSEDDLQAMAHGGDESLHDYIRKLKNVKKRIRLYDGSDSVQDINLELDSCLDELNQMECDIEIRANLGEKIKQLKQVLAEKEYRLEIKKRPISLPESTHTMYIKAVFVIFQEITTKLAQLKEEIIEYYGTSEDDEYQIIMTRLEECRSVVKNVEDKGVVKIVLSKEEYEDYIERMMEQFKVIVRGNERDFNFAKEKLSDIDRKRNRRKRSHIMDSINIEEVRRNDDEEEDDAENNEIPSSNSGIEKLKSDENERSNEEPANSIDEGSTAPPEDIEIATHNVDDKSSEDDQCNNDAEEEESIEIAHEIHKDQIIPSFSNVSISRTFSTETEDEFYDCYEEVPLESPTEENKMVFINPIRNNYVKSDNFVVEVPENGFAAIFGRNTFSASFDNDLEDINDVYEECSANEVINEYKEEIGIVDEESDIQKTEIENKGRKMEDDIHDIIHDDDKMRTAASNNEETKNQDCDEKVVKEYVIGELNKNELDNDEESVIQETNKDDKSYTKNIPAIILLNENNIEVNPEYDQIFDSVDDVVTDKEGLALFEEASKLDLEYEALILDDEKSQRSIPDSDEVDFGDEEGKVGKRRRKNNFVRQVSTIPEIPSDVEEEASLQHQECIEESGFKQEYGEQNNDIHKEVNIQSEENQNINGGEENFNKPYIKSETDRKIRVDIEVTADVEPRKEAIEEVPKNESTIQSKDVDVDPPDTTQNSSEEPNESNRLAVRKITPNFDFEQIKSDLLKIRDCVLDMKRCISEFEGNKDDQTYTSIMENLYDSMMIMNSIKSSSREVIEMKQGILHEISKCIKQLGEKTNK